MEDFDKPKIVWNRIAAQKQFALVEAGIFVQDSMHFIMGKELNFLVSVLNSNVIQWVLSWVIGEAAGGNAGNADNIWNLSIPKYDKDIRLDDNTIYSLYKFTSEEIAFIESQQNQ